MTKQPYLFLLLSSLAIFNTQAAEKNQIELPPRPQDFAYAVPLQFSGQEAIYQTALPFSVYQHTVRSDLGDMRVFNGNGEVVPYRLYLPPTTIANQATRVSLNYFPLQSSGNTSLDQLSIQIRRNASGSLISIDNRQKPAVDTKLSGYLLDTSALKQPLQALELSWQYGKENFVGSLLVESSDDLKYWHTISRDAPLAYLQYGAHQLLQNRVEFKPSTQKYLRLSWPPTQTPLQLSKIEAEFAATTNEAPLLWQTAISSAGENKAGEYQFDLGAHLPIRKLRLKLPQNNTLVQAQLFSRAQSNDNWQPAGNAILYQLHHSGQALSNPDIAINRNHRYWLLRVEQDNGGLGSGLPELQAGWQSQQLQFVTRGNPPFQLAYGNRTVKPAEFQLQNILPVTGTNTQFTAATAQTGAQITLSGDTLLTPPAPALPWKKWLLWGFLILAVLLLGWMANGLVKQMNNSGKP